MLPFRQTTLAFALATSAVFAWSVQESDAASRAKAVQCTVILDVATGAVLHRDGTCDQRFNPFSSFKLPLALMGYDAGILKDARTPAWDYDPAFNAVKRDQRRVDPTIWEKDSVLWFSREITRQLGAEAFAAYISKFNYGNKDISGDPGKNNGLTHSWLASSLKISPDEQAAFVRRLLTGSLPVPADVAERTIAIIPTFETANGWTVQGKTGSGWLRDPDGQINKNRPSGWFVGWATRDGRQIAFARLEVDNRKVDAPKGLKVRAQFLETLPGLMK